MADEHFVSGAAFDIPDVRSFVPRKLKPFLFILFVLVTQFSGGVYLAGTAEMMGSTALMREDILMAGYASLIGMAVNFAIMFRINFRFSTRSQLIVSGLVLIAANIICAHAASVPVLILTCLISGWFRMQATLACNSTIQLWITPERDMAVFFCYVYLLVDGVIQLSGLATIYTSFAAQWQFMHWIMTGLLALMVIAATLLLKRFRKPMFIPLKGIDWTGSVLWAAFMVCFAFVCVYGEFYDWWAASEIRAATVLGLAFAGINLWRASFLQNPYIPFKLMRNRNVVRATCVYLVFYTLMASGNVFEGSYAGGILGFDKTNLIDLNWYSIAGIIAGCAFTYATFARRKWRYKTMTAIAFAIAACYLAWFYFFMDYGIEKEMLAVPLFLRNFASVIISIVFLTSIVQCGLPFEEFPPGLTINGFTGAVMSATLCPALIGELFRRTLARNVSLLGANVVDFNPAVSPEALGSIYGQVSIQALAVSIKEIYGLLLMAAIVLLAVILVSYGNVRPRAIFPKWSALRRRTEALVRRFI